MPPPCPTCCALLAIEFGSSWLDLPVGMSDRVGIIGVNSCTNGSEVSTPDFPTWESFDVGIAKASYAKVQGIAPGSTTVYANGFVNGPGECVCSPVFKQPTLPVTVYGIPTSETTQFYGVYQMTQGTFQMTSIRALIRRWSLCRGKAALRRVDSLVERIGHGAAPNRGRQHMDSRAEPSASRRIRPGRYRFFLRGCKPYSDARASPWRWFSLCSYYLPGNDLRAGRQHLRNAYTENVLTQTITSHTVRCA